MGEKPHRFMGALMVLCSCKIMMYTIARGVFKTLFYSELMNGPNKLECFISGRPFMSIAMFRVKAGAYSRGDHLPQQHFSNMTLH